MKKIAAAALFAFVTMAANASPITVTYTESSESGLGLHGSFTGIDANNDGWLTLNELSAWTNSFDGATLASLNAIGSFDYKHNVWLNDAANWYGEHDAFMTWDDWTLSVSAASEFPWAFETTIESGKDVPEPASLALMGISLAALGAVRRKKQG